MSTLRIESSITGNSLPICTRTTSISGCTLRFDTRCLLGWLFGDDGDDDDDDGRRRRHSPGENQNFDVRSSEPAAQQAENIGYSCTKMSQL